MSLTNDRIIELVNSIPADIRAQLSTVDVVARTVAADRYEKMAATSYGETHLYATRRAKEVLKARPAGQVRDEIAALHKLADGSHDRDLRAGFRERARELDQANPVPSIEDLATAAQMVRGAGTDKAFGPDRFDRGPNGEVVRKHVTAGISKTASNATRKASGARVAGPASTVGHVSEAARFTKLAEDTVDPDLRHYYQQKAKDARVHGR